MIMKYKIEKLGNLVELKQGLAINSQSNYLVSEVETSLSLLRIADMPTKRKVIFMSEKTPSRYIANRDDIIYTRTGQVGLVFTGQEGVVHNNCFRVNSLNEKVLLNKYLYWVLKSKYLYTLANTYAAGAAQPDLPHTSFKKIKIPLPDINLQQKIANILSRYDEAIENNNKRIKLLEQMAQNLYKEWFVRFRFPGWEKVELKKSRIGKIPSTFNVLKQNEVISDYIGGGWGEDDESSNFPIQSAVVRGTDFPNFLKGDISSCPIRFHKKSNYDSRVIKGDDIILEVSGGTQEQPVGRIVIVTKEKLNRFDNKLICASFCKLIHLNKQIVAPFFYYYWMQFVYDTRIIDRYQLQSTGIINFKFEYFLRKGDILLPPSDLMWEFDSKVRNIHKQIENFAKENENLAKQRDLLLPRLMSGKLDVI